MALLRQVRDGVVFVVRLQPSAGANRIIGALEDAEGEPMIKAMVTAAPEKGKANSALIGLLAKSWKIPKSDVSVIKGMTERRKTLHIAGDFDKLNAHLEHLVGENNV
ncbi:MAG: DUF167 family protein [Proteobacteria bacterium]|nr:DUF167 family protein [Pseudomonadota bacterium]